MCLQKNELHNQAYNNAILICLKLLLLVSSWYFVVTTHNSHSKQYNIYKTEIYNWIIVLEMQHYHFLTLQVYVHTMYSIEVNTKKR